VRVVIAEHFVQRAPLAEQVNQQHRPGTRFHPRNLERFAGNVAEAFADDGNGSVIAERSTRYWAGPVGAGHGTPSKTQ
jgi:hypothetical protein